MKITEIARSFSKTLQEEPYSPISIFASYKGELDGSETPEEIKKFSDSLYNLAEEDVRGEQKKIERVKELKESMSGEAFPSEPKSDDPF